MIETNQTLNYTNLFSMRKSLTPTELQEEILKIEEFLLNNSIKIIGGVIGAAATAPVSAASAVSFAVAGGPIAAVGLCTLAAAGLFVNGIFSLI